LLNDNGVVYVCVVLGSGALEAMAVLERSYQPDIDVRIDSLFHIIAGPTLGQGMWWSPSSVRCPSHRHVTSRKLSKIGP